MWCAACARLLKGEATAVPRRRQETGGQVVVGNCGLGIGLRERERGGLESYKSSRDAASGIAKKEEGGSWFVCIRGDVVTTAVDPAASSKGCDMPKICCCLRMSVGLSVVESNRRRTKGMRQLLAARGPNSSMKRAKD